MYRLDREEFVKPSLISLWAVLGFQAGFINAFGFLASGRYVSHVTGFGSQIGVALAERAPLFALELFGIPFFFILGSFTSGLMTSARIERGREPKYDIVTLLLPVLILTLLVFGQAGIFGVFGEQLTRQRDFLLLFLLTFVCGMQNGCFSTMTRGQIRTTHLTGISTDIGTDLARLWYGKLTPAEQALTRMVNLSRVATFVSFSMGSVTSVLVSREWGFGALMVPLASSSAVYVSSRLISRQLNRKFSSQVVAAA